MSKAMTNAYQNKSGILSDELRVKNSLTPAELMAVVRISSRQQFWLWVHRERVPYYKISVRKVLFDTNEIDQWFANRHCYDGKAKREKIQLKGGTRRG